MIKDKKIFIERFKKAKKYYRKAHEYSTTDKINELENELFSKRRNALSDVWENVVDMINFIKRYINVGIDKAPKKAVISMVAAIIYAISPLDFLPDIVPGLGFIDDVIIIQYVFNKFMKDIEISKKVDNDIIDVEPEKVI